MNPEPLLAFIAVVIFFCVGLLLGGAVSEKVGFENGALAQKNGQITWHTNAVTNVTFAANQK